MYVEYTEFLGVEDPQSLQGEPTVDEVLKLFDRMSWQYLSMISVSLDSGQVMELSGSRTDGLSIVHIDGDTSTISRDAPDMETARAAIKSFAGGYQGWRDMIEMMPFEDANQSAAKTEFVTPDQAAQRLFWIAALTVFVLVLVQMA